MLEFIAKNKEWLFSGIGVTILGAFFVIAKWLYERSKTNTKHKAISGEPSKRKWRASDDSIEYYEHPTAKEIDDQISMLPPFQQVGAEKNYLGLKIKWKVRVGLIFPGMGNAAKVSCNDTSGYFRYIHITVSLSEYPQFKSLSEKEVFWIYGEVSGLEASGFHVNVHRIQFLK